VHRYDAATDTYEPPLTDFDRMVIALAEIRSHMLAMVASIDRLEWFVHSGRPELFDQDAD